MDLERLQALVNDDQDQDAFRALTREALRRSMRGDHRSQLIDGAIKINALDVLPSLLPPTTLLRRYRGHDADEFLTSRGGRPLTLASPLNMSMADFLFGFSIDDPISLSLEPIGKDHRQREFIIRTIEDAAGKDLGQEARDEAYELVMRMKPSTSIENVLSDLYIEQSYYWPFFVKHFYLLGREQR